MQLIKIKASFFPWLQSSSAPSRLMGRPLPISLAFCHLPCPPCPPSSTSRFARLSYSNASKMSRLTRSSAKAQLNINQNTSSCPDVSTAASKQASSIPILLFNDQIAWETWLIEHHSETSGLWVQIAKKNADKPTVSYDEALDVALCFGWIDGQRKSHDEQHFIQRFTPRRKNSMWSKRNVDKVEVLIRSGRMKPPGQAEIDAAKADGRWGRAYSSASVMEVPLDFQAALEGNKEAVKFFDALNKTQRYAFLWRIETAKRAETRRRKIVQFVNLLAEHKTL